MGAVYQAYDDELGVAVAIKTILHGDGSDAHTLRDQVSRFKSELLLARQVTHKNVVRIHDLGEFSGLKYITMSYVAGETLAALVARNGPLPVPQVLALARQIADGMAAAHEVGVVHRDMKPENVMVTPDGQALIMDFGIASSSQGGSKDGGPIVGTISYMAPEQARGQAGGRASRHLRVRAHSLRHAARADSARRRHASAMDELRSRFEAHAVVAAPLSADVPEALEAVVMRAAAAGARRRASPTRRRCKDALSTLTDDGTSAPRRGAARAVAGDGRQHARATALVASGVWWWTHAAGRGGEGAGVGAGRRLREQDRRSGLRRRRRAGARARHRKRLVRHALSAPRRAARGRRHQGRAHGSTSRRRGWWPCARAWRGCWSAASSRPGRSSASRRGCSAGGNDQTQDEPSLTVDAADRNGVLDAVGPPGRRRARGARRRSRRRGGGLGAQETFTAASLEAAAAYAKAQELQIAGRVEDAIAQYQETLRLDPELGRAYSGLAAQYTNLARTADAEANYEQALARLDRMTDREKFRTRGSYYLFARKPELAAQEFTALVKAYPADTSGLSNLALASFYQRDMAQALEQGQRRGGDLPEQRAAAVERGALRHVRRAVRGRDYRLARGSQVEPHASQGLRRPRALAARARAVRRSARHLRGARRRPVRPGRRLPPSGWRTWPRPRGASPTPPPR